MPESSGSQLQHEPVRDNLGTGIALECAKRLVHGGIRPHAAFARKRAGQRFELRDKVRIRKRAAIRAYTLSLHDALPI